MIGHQVRMGEEAGGDFRQMDLLPQECDGGDSMVVFAG
jgi:hypothetical protein